MATLREIRRRIVSIRSTQKITRAMKMIAGVRFRHAQEALHTIKTYSKSMDTMLSHLVESFNGNITHPLFERREIKKSLIIIVSGDRGMCGAFNNNIIRASMDYLDKNYPNWQKGTSVVELIAIGKKAGDYLTKHGISLLDRYTGVFNDLSKKRISSIAQVLIQSFLEKKFDKIEIICNEFKSVSQQKAIVEQFLPVPSIPVSGNVTSFDYIFEPSREKIIERLLPVYLTFKLWRTLLESHTAEEAARMTAMNMATENANELMNTLTLLYNKARQASITRELIEVISGADALTKAY